MPAPRKKPKLPPALRLRIKRRVERSEPVYPWEELKAFPLQDAPLQEWAKFHDAMMEHMTNMFGLPRKLLAEPESRHDVGTTVGIGPADHVLLLGNYGKQTPSPEYALCRIRDITRKAEMPWTADPKFLCVDPSGNTEPVICQLAEDYITQLDQPRRLIILKDTDTTPIYEKPPVDHP